VEEIKSSTGEIIQDFEEIKQQATRHFIHLYMKEGDLNEELSNSFISYLPKFLVSEDGNQDLNKQIEDEEILKEINQFNLDKALGPDGFTIHLYKRCCSIIKFDFIRMLRYVQSLID